VLCSVGLVRLSDYFTLLVNWNLSSSYGRLIAGSVNILCTYAVMLLSNRWLICFMLRLGFLINTMAFTRLLSLKGRHASHLLTFSALQSCRLHDFNKEVNKFMFGVVLLAFCLSLMELI